MIDKEILYGRQVVLECLRANRRTAYRLLQSAEAGSSGPLFEALKLARSRRLPILPLEKRELDRLTHSGNHQGIVAEVSPYPYETLDTVAPPPDSSGESPFWLLLDHLQDPQNVGSILRTADAAGVQAVVMPRDRSAGVTPAVVRASSGAAEHLRVAQVVNLVQAMDALRQRGVWVYGLDGNPGNALCTSTDLKGPVALVVGSEGPGLSPLVRKKCDGLVRLPMSGRVASLNAAVAAAIALFEIRRQRATA